MDQSAWHLHPTPILQPDLHLLLVDLHVIDVEGEVVRPSSDLNVDEDFPIDGEIIRNEEGDEIELIPAINKNKTELNL